MIQKLIKALKIANGEVVIKRVISDEMCKIFQVDLLDNLTCEFLDYKGKRVLKFTHPIEHFALSLDTLETEILYQDEDLHDTVTPRDMVTYVTSSKTLEVIDMLDQFQKDLAMFSKLSESYTYAALEWFKKQPIEFQLEFGEKKTSELVAYFLINNNL